MAVPRRAAGFTLIEMLVTITIIGLAMSAVFGFGQNMLPQSRLAASAADIGDNFVRLRAHALFSQHEVVFEYDLDQQGFRAYYPVELDAENARVLGPGQTPVVEFTPVRAGMRLDRVVMDDGSERDDGLVQIAISALGVCPAHEAVVLNPEFPELELYTVRIDGLTNTYRTERGRRERARLGDADFR